MNEITDDIYQDNRSDLSDITDNPPKRGDLCAYLVDAGKIKQADADRAVRLFQDQAGRESLVSLLIKLGLLSDMELAQALSDYTGYPLVIKKEYPDELVDSDLISIKFLKENKLRKNFTII